jgi:hypothetical protein
MNLHSIVAPIIGAVNTNELVSLRQSIGFAVNVDFSRSPTYSTFPMSAQVQGLQSDDIRILNGLGIQGERRKVYLWGAWTGLVRSLQKGNDLMVRSDGSVWKVAYVFEDFGHSVSGTTGWCSVAAVLQSPASEDFYNPPLPPPPPVPGAVTAISLTANYVVQNTDSGTWFDNDSAAGPLTATLPAPSPGLEYHFTVTSAQTFQISAPTGVSVALGTAQSAPGGSVSSNLIFSSIFVYAPRGASNQWIAVSDTGGWNVA